MYLASKTVKALEGALKRGCTSARDPGGLEAGFRDAVNDGIILGPRLQTSVVIISPVNGIHDRTTAQGIQNPPIQGVPNAVCEGHGPDAVRTKVREVLRAGADFIKIAMTGGVSSPRILPTQRVFSQAEVEAVVDEAHAFGVPVICHALGGPGVLMAVQAGVDTIEHGCYLDDQTIEAIVSHGTWYVPTFTVYRNHRTMGPEFKQVRARALEQPHQNSFNRAREAGVKIAMGSDAGGYNHDFALELECLVEAGMTPIEAITTGTKKSAECLGLDDRVGTLEAGKDADIVVADASCLDNIGLLRDPQYVHMVIQQGNIIKSLI